MRRRGISKVAPATGVYDESLIYDNTNITSQFPNANNTRIDSTGNVLTATADNGEAISIFKTQDIGQSDFVALVAPFEGKFEFANISDVSSTIDTLIASTPIANGDNLVIVKDDDSIHEIVASGVIENGGTSTIIATPAMTSDTTPNGVSSASTVGFAGFEAWKAFDQTSGVWLTDVTQSGYLQYQFPIITAINEYIIVPTNNARSPKTWTLEASNSGAFSGEEIVLDTQTNITDWNAPTPHASFPFSNSTAYLYYRLVVTANNGDTYLGIQELEYYEYSPTYQLDTTAITAGEIPSRAYLVDTKASFELSGGFVEAEKDTDSYVYIDTTIVNDIFSDGSIVDTYPLNGDKTSLSGTNDGTGTLTNYSPSKFELGGDFDGTRGLMNIPIAIGSVSTVSMWIKKSILELTDVYPIGTTSTSFESYVQIGANNTGQIAVFNFRVNAVLAANVFTNDVHNHILYSFDGVDTVRLYHNSILVDTKVGTVNSFNGDIGLGQYRSNSGVSGDFNIDQVRLFNRELTQQEVATLYNEGDKFKTTRTYKDLVDPIGSQTVRTKVNLKATGDKMTELKATLNKKA